MPSRSVPVPALAVLFPAAVPYERALAWQARLVEARQADAIPDVVLALEHEPVITRGVRARDAHLLATPERLARLGVALCDTPRGGDVTYHGPGQVVLYPILKLQDAEADAHLHVTRLEESAIRMVAGFGVPSYRRPGKTGVWTDAGKLAAIGVRFQRWVSSHGISLNVSPDLSHFGLIVPCGLAGEPVTSLAALLGDRCPSTTAARDGWLQHVAAVFGRRLEPHA